LRPSSSRTHRAYHVWRLKCCSTYNRLSSRPLRPRGRSDGEQESLSPILGHRQHTGQSTALWFTSLAVAAGLVSLGLVLLRAAAIPAMGAVDGTTSLWWLPVVIRVLVGGLLLLVGIGLAWHRRWWLAAAAIALGTGISILGAQWETAGPVNAHLAAQAAAGLGLYLTPPQVPGWAVYGFYWPLQFLLSLVAILCCAASPGRALFVRRLPEVSP
jgi:hypothetical protein